MNVHYTIYYSQEEDEQQDERLEELLDILKQHGITNGVTLDVESNEADNVPKDVHKLPWCILANDQLKYGGGVEAIGQYLSDGGGKRPTNMEESRKLALVEKKRLQRELETAPADRIDDLHASLDLIDMHLSKIGHFNYDEEDVAASHDDIWDVTRHIEEDDAQLRFVDRALENVEMVARGAVGYFQVLGSYLGISEGEPGAPTRSSSGNPMDQDFDVIRTNWYYRQQTRVLRICEGSIQRVHPMTGEVRVNIPYEEIKKIVVSDRNTFCIVTRQSRNNPLIANEEEHVYQSKHLKLILAAIQWHRPNIVIDKTSHDELGNSL